MRLENETVWLNRQQMAVLFGRDVKTIGKHIANALRQELADPAVGAKNATTEASLKDLGKSLFAFSRLQIPAADILSKLP